MKKKKIIDILSDEKIKDLKFPFTFYTMETLSNSNSAENGIVKDLRSIESKFYSTTCTHTYTFYKPISNIL